MEEENMVQDESSSQEYEGEGQYSEEEVDRIADTAIEAIQDILKYFNVGEVSIEEYEGDEGELILDITGDDLAVLIGRHGRTLDSLQFLISSITSRIVGCIQSNVLDLLTLTSLIAFNVDHDGIAMTNNAGRNRRKG